MIAIKGEGVSEWRQVRQADIDAFAAVTGDWHWLHTDAREAADGPFGGTVAQGMLTLSLVPVLCAQVIDFSAWPMRVNYGFDRVRFPAPVHEGELVRAHVSEVAVTGSAAVARVSVTIERQTSHRPACACEWLVHRGPFTLTT